MNFAAPQIIMIVLLAVGFAWELDKHGEYKQGKHNVFIHVVSMSISVAILWWGGFWG